MKKCKHLWRPFLRSSASCTWKCHWCDAEYSRDYTKEEKKLVALAQREQQEETTQTHRVNWEIQKQISFVARSRGEQFDGNPLVTGMGAEKLYTATDVKSRFIRIGYALQLLLEKLQKKFSKDVELVGCDDRDFMSSDIALVAHESDAGYMGTTMYVVPQCNDEPAEVFLYPHHVDDLIAALKKFQKRARAKRRRQDGPAEKRVWRIRPGKIDPEKITPRTKD